MTTWKIVLNIYICLYEIIYIYIMYEYFVYLSAVGQVMTNMIVYYSLYWFATMELIVIDNHTDRDSKVFTMITRDICKYICNDGAMIVMILQW